MWRFIRDPGFAPAPVREICANPAEVHEHGLSGDDDRAPARRAEGARLSA